MTSNVPEIRSYAASRIASWPEFGAAQDGAVPRELLLEQQLSDARLGLAEIYRELYEAAQMQRRLSGPNHLSRGGFEIAAELFPVRHVSGDFFNISDYGNSQLLAIGDIAGKGMAAAMWFTHLLGLTRLHAECSQDPAQAMTAINRRLCTRTPTPPLTSMVLARLDVATGEFVYCNAGHPEPLLLRANGSVDRLGRGGPVLGAVQSATYESAHTALMAGDVLVGYSDGLTECRNDCNEEFGVQRILDALMASRSASASRLLFSVVGAVQDFAGSQLREDDFGLLVVRHTGRLM